MNSIQIDPKNKKVEISLNKNFYSIDAVKKAISDFKKVGNFSVSNKKSIIVSLKLKNSSDIENIGYEFCNYVLALMKNEASV